MNMNPKTEVEIDKNMAFLLANIATRAKELDHTDYANICYKFNVALAKLVMKADPLIGAFRV